MKKVWILEDDEQIAAICRENVEKIVACQITCFHSIKEFSASLLKHYPDLLIADNHLVEGKFEDLLANEQTKQWIRKVPVLAISSYDSTETIEKFLQNGVSDFLVKPFNLNIFRVKCGRLLNAKGAKIRLLPEKLRAETDQGVSEKMTALEYRLLSLLVAAAPSYQLSRSHIASHIWGETKIGKKLDVLIFGFRRKIQPAGLKLDFVKPHSYALHLKA